MAEDQDKPVNEGEPIRIVFTPPAVRVKCLGHDCPAGGTEPWC